MSQLTKNENMWPIEKCATYQNEKWTNLNQSQLILKIHSEMLFIISDNTIHYILKLNNSMKGYMKENILIIACNNEGSLNKIKMKFLQTPDVPNNVSTALEPFFLIHKEDKLEIDSEKLTDKGINYQELFNKELTRVTNFQNNELVFPPGFPLQEFLKTCILDPSFPDMVDQVEMTLHQYLY